MMYNTKLSIAGRTNIMRYVRLVVAGMTAAGLIAGCGHRSATGATAAPVTPATVAASVPPQMRAKVQMQESQAQQVSEEMAAHQAAMAANHGKH